MVYKILKTFFNERSYVLTQIKWLLYKPCTFSSNTFLVCLIISMSHYFVIMYKPFSLKNLYFDLCKYHIIVNL